MKLTSNKLTRKAHAKLNLFLEVTGKRPDGYHELYSLAVFLDLADEITVEPAAAITVTETGNTEIADNIILKTAEKLAREFNVTSGAKITFTKNIPIAAGLGGGSADAAATLVLLDSLWNLNIPHEEMYQLALELGADVPACLYSILENKNAAIFSGVGEIITSAPDIPQLFFTIVNPAIPLPTEQVFRTFRYEGLGYEQLNTKGDLIENIAERSNDLESAAISLVPEISLALAELESAKNCRLARMTGSGATVFGIFKKHEDARTAAISIIKKHPGWQIGPVGLKKTSLLSRREKLLRPFLKKRVRLAIAVRDSTIATAFTDFFALFRIKSLQARCFSVSIAAHVIALFFYDVSFMKEPLPPPEFVTVAFAVENPIPVEATYEPAAGEAPETTPQPQAESIPQPPSSPQSQPVKKKTAAHKKTTVKTAAKQGTLNASAYGNTNKPAQNAAKDYLQLLQYTVQEMSEIPNADANLKGNAVLQLAFNRQGYVLAYSLKTKTGVKTLDDAAEKLAQRLMNQPLPPVPDNFDRGDEILQYDFRISYPRQNKA